MKLVAQSIAVRTWLEVPAKNITVCGSKEEVTINPPHIGLGYKPIRLLLLSHKWREGQVTWTKVFSMEYTRISKVYYLPQHSESLGESLQCFLRHCQPMNYQKTEALRCQACTYPPITSSPCFSMHVRKSQSPGQFFVVLTMNMYL